MQLILLLWCSPVGLQDSVASSRHLASDGIRKFVRVFCVAKSQSAATPRSILWTIFPLERYYDSIWTSWAQASCRAALCERLVDRYCFDMGQRNTNRWWVSAIHYSVNEGPICHIKLPRCRHFSGTASMLRPRHMQGLQWVQSISIRW